MARGSLWGFKESDMTWQLNNNNNRPNSLTNKYETSHLSAAKYTFFSSAQGTFSRTDNVRPQNKAQ